MQVDDSQGYLIDRFAIEDLWRQPHYNLTVSVTGEYLVAEAAESPVSGFAAIPPAKDYDRGGETPITRLEMDRSPSKWLVTKPVPFAMKRDPRKDLGGWEKLRPAHPRYPRSQAPLGDAHPRKLRFHTAKRNFARGRFPSGAWEPEKPQNEAIRPARHLLVNLCLSTPLRCGILERVGSSDHSDFLHREFDVFVRRLAG
jgi:hypothetical protein